MSATVERLLAQLPGVLPGGTGGVLVVDSDSRGGWARLDVAVERSGWLLRTRTTVVDVAVSAPPEGWSEAQWRQVEGGGWGADRAPGSGSVFRRVWEGQGDPPREALAQALEAVVDALAVLHLGVRGNDLRLLAG